MVLMPISRQHVGHHRLTMVRSRNLARIADIGAVDLDVVHTLKPCRYENDAAPGSEIVEQDLMTRAREDSAARC